MAGIGDIGVRVTSDITDFTSGMDRAAQVADTAMKRTAQAQAIAQVASDRLIKSLEHQVATFGMSDAELLRYKANMLGAGDAAKPLIDRLEAMSVAAGGHAGSLRGATAETHSFSLANAGASRELIVLAHEMSQGNYSRFGGSMMVLAERTGAASLLMSPLGLGIAAVGGTLAVLSYEIYKNQKAWNDIGDSIKTTSGYAGLTQEQIYSLSQSFTDGTKSIAEHREALTALVATGRVTGDQLASFGHAALDMANDTGASIEDVVKSLSRLSGDAKNWASEYQQQHHVFTAADIALIDSLDKQGKQAEATAATIAALESAHNRLKTATDGSASSSRSWIDAWKDWFDGKTHILEPTNFEKINSLLAARKDLEQELQSETKRGLAADMAATQAQLDANKREINSIRDKIAAQQGAVKKVAAAGAGGDAQVVANNYLDGGAKSQAAKHQDAIDKENKAFNETIANLDKNSKTYEDVVKHHKENLLEIDLEYRSKLQKDDPTTTLMAASLKILDGQIAAENALMKRREKSIDSEVAAQMITLAEGLKEKRQAIADDYAATQALYAREAADVEARKAKLDPTTQKKQRAEMDKQLDEIETKRKAAEQASSAAMVQATGAQFKIRTDFTLATAEWVRQQSLANDAQQFSIDLMGQSTVEAAKLTAARQIYLQTEEMIRKKLDEDKNADVSGLRAAADAQVQRANALIDERQAKATDPWFNARESLRKYGETAADTGAQIGTTIADGMKNAEDAFVTFATTGKLSFTNMVTSMLTDLARLEARKAVSALGSMALDGLESYLGSSISISTTGSAGDLISPSKLSVDTGQFANLDYLKGLPGRAKGGYVGAGQTYMVGEVGPEVFTPSTSGTIIPNHALGGSGSAPQINLVTNISGNGTTGSSSGDSGSARAVGDAINAKVKAVIVQEMRQGGIIWNYQKRGIAP